LNKHTFQLTNEQKSYILEQKHISDINNYENIYF